MAFAFDEHARDTFDTVLPGSRETASLLLCDAEEIGYRPDIFTLSGDDLRQTIERLGGFLQQAVGEIRHIHPPAFDLYQQATRLASLQHRLIQRFIDEGSVGGQALSELTHSAEYMNLLKTNLSEKVAQDPSLSTKPDRPLSIREQQRFRTFNVVRFNPASDTTE